MDPDDRVWQERGLRDAVLEGDDQAWRVLYDRSFDSLYAYVHFRTGRRPEWTDEVVQESWLIAVRRIRRFDPIRGSFEAWLRGIAENVIRNQRRRARRLGQVERPGQAEVSHGGSSGRESSPPDDLAERIELTLSALPERAQAVLRAKYGDDLSVAEIAARWGESAKAIESLLARARSAFRRAYDRLARDS